MRLNCGIQDILIGMPSTTCGDIMGKIRDEHIHFLVAELDVKVHIVNNILDSVNPFSVC